MKRPKLVNFSGIESDQYIHIRAALTYSQSGRFQVFSDLNQNFKDFVPTRPIENLGLLSRNKFRLKVIGLNEMGEEAMIRSFDSDSFGNFNFKVPQSESSRIVSLRLYETKTFPGLDVLVGSFIPTRIHSPKKIFITDFDKTLVDTRYSTMKELFLSLRNPVNYFPPVSNSIELAKRYTSEGYQPFVVSASPHFYENAIRDWLYQHEIYTSNILLKDYRNFFSLFEGDLSTKDLKSQGFYKLNTIVDILLMTGIPDELILVGDGFESDTIIYLTLAAVMIGRYDPWPIWNQIKKEESFKLTNHQHFRFLSKFYQLKNLSNAHKPCDIKIYIRCKEPMYEPLKNRSFKLDFANQLHHLVEYYIG